MRDGRLTYVFVGAFPQRERNDGSVGGQLYACTTLVASEISRHVAWIPIDSMMVSVPPPPVARRIGAAGRRLATFSRALDDRTVDGVLIFASARLSFVEKGVMAILARTRGKRVVLAPRSGLITDDLASSAFMRRFVPHVLRQCDVVLCQGAGWKTTFQRIAGMPDERFAVVPNWIDPAPYEAIAKRRRRRDGGATFLYLGWLEPYKGIHDLVEAVALAREALAGCRVIVCGRGSAETSARRLARQRGVEQLIDFRGWTTGANKDAVLAEADVLVLPSHREGMPNALLEAMACGMPVIGTRVGGVPDVIVSDEVGVLLPPHDPAALARAMSELAADPDRRARLAAGAREHIRRHHDIRAVWPRLLDVLRSPGAVAASRPH